MDDQPVVSEKNSNMMEWRVLLLAIDDAPVGTDPLRGIEECTRDFRARLIEELRNGVIPCGWGPLVKKK